MAGEEDQWLPKPPPPRPARRDAAIDAALRRFDGREDAPAAPPERARRPGWLLRPQAAMLATATLLVIVGVPAALIGIRNTPYSRGDKTPPPVVVRNDGSAQRTAPARGVAAAPQATADVAKAPAASAAEPGAAAKAPEADAPARAAPFANADSAEGPAVLAPAPMTAAAPPAPPPPPPPPPSPPPPAAAPSPSAPAVAEDIVVSGTHIANRRLAEPKAGSALSPARAYAPFLARLKSAVASNNRRAVISLIDFPLRVNMAGGVRTYRDRRSVERDFDRIFTPRVKRAIAAQRADSLFIRDQGAMIGHGELWFDHSCPNAACSPPGPVRIHAVNP